MEKNKIVPGVASGLSRTLRPNKLERKEKIIKKRKPQSACLNSPDAKLGKLKMKRKILTRDQWLREIKMIHYHSALFD